MKPGGARRLGPSVNRSLWLYALHQTPKANDERIVWKCPKCAVAMRSVRLPTVTVEICPECRGLFLDDGELEKLAAPE